MIFCVPILCGSPGKKYWENILLIFYSAEAKLMIELDASQHYEDENMDKDEERTTFLEGYGLQVLRIPNNEVSRNFRGVCEYIDATVRQSLSQPTG